ncbi:MAG: hypothetical protein Q7R98_00110 [Candidatus Jorgensenbacteria bacterium]|nr:hypothetical protein [Candidatus Jorgensenbacteria bacterium]
MEWFLEILRKTLEYQNFGFNELFISAVATVIFTVLQGYGVLMQGRRIWRERSGESISVTFFSYATFYFLAFLVYGAEKWSIAMVFNGVLGFVHIPILAGLLKFKGFTRNEWILLGAFSTMVPAFFILDGEPQEVFLMICLLGILATLVKQTLDTWSYVKLRRSGRADKPIALEPRFLVSFMATNAVWFIIALCIGNWPLAVFNPLAFLLIGVNLTMYYLPSRGWAREQRTT